MYYRMTVAGLERDLPICPLNDKLSIAGFVIFGDQELTVACARDLLAKAPEYDYILTAEAKGIPLAHEMARQAGDAKYILARKGPKLYMRDIFSVTVQSITTAKEQKLYLDGADAALMKGKRILLVDDVISTGESLSALEALVENCMAKLSPQQKYFRGLYCGGTFTEEALQYFAANNQNVPLYSNLKNAYSTKLEDSEVSQGHTILDLGAEDFTAKAPHPVFDPGLRLKRLRQELEDPQVGVVLLDFITGPGVAYDPITAFAEDCAKHPSVIFISNICGSLEDPQNVEEKQKLLEKAGVIVTKSNYQSSRLASALMNALERR